MLFSPVLVANEDDWVDKADGPIPIFSMSKILMLSMIAFKEMNK